MVLKKTKNNYSRIKRPEYNFFLKRRFYSVPKLKYFLKYNATVLLDISK